MDIYFRQSSTLLFIYETALAQLDERYKEQLKRMKLTIRKEDSKDMEAVSDLIEKAFKSEQMSDQNEHILVEKLRKSNAFIPNLSLVAEIEQKIVGHILLTKVKIENGQHEFDSLALAPVSVHQAYQRKGIGGILINEAHHKAKELGHQSIVLLGHEKYYLRFGYKQANNFGITFPFEAPQENCIAIELVKNGLKGVNGIVVYPKAFYE